MEQTILDIARTATWPTAVALIAFSPLGKAIGSWLQSSGGRQTPQQSAVSERITSAMERQATSLENQAIVLQQVQQALAVLMDRTPRRGE